MVEQHENNSMEGVRNSCNKSSNFPFNIRSLKFSQLLISKLPTRGGILWMFLWCIQQTSRPSAIQEHRNFVTKQMKFDQSLEPGMQLQCDDDGGDRNPWKNNIETILLHRILLYLANLLLKWLSDTLLSNGNSTLRLIPAPTTTTWRKEDELTEFDFYGINVAAAHSHSHLHKTDRRMELTRFLARHMVSAHFEFLLICSANIYTLKCCLTRLLLTGLTDKQTTCDCV